MLREITPEETGILYECMEDLGRHHNDVSVYFKGIYPTISLEEIVRQFAAEMEAEKFLYRGDRRRGTGHRVMQDQHNERNRCSGVSCGTQ